MKMKSFSVLIYICYFGQLVLGDYWSTRQCILEQEEQVLLGGKLKLNEKEDKVNKIIMQYKDKELDVAFSNVKNFAPAHSFFKTKELVENSTIFKIIKKLPKGASLHSHDFASASFEAAYGLTYLENLYGCVVDERIKLRFFDKPTSDCDWKLLTDLRRNASFESFLQGQLSIVVSDPDEMYPDINTVWRKFSQTFTSLIGYLTYKQAYQQYFWKVLEEFYEDNVKYLEFRTILPSVYDLNGTVYGPEENVKLYIETLDQFKKLYPDFIGAKMIYSAVRTCNASQLEYHTNLTLHLQALYPDFVVGFDLVGQEDPGNSLKMYVPELLKLSGKTKFFFHAAETDWNGQKTDINIVDAVLLNSSRIGHGYGVLKHPEVLQMIIERGIAIEVSPISNQVLKLVEDLRNHPAVYLFNINAPVVVSCDDPGMWGSRGLSYDWYIAFVGMASRHSDLRFLKQLALNSLNYSAMSDKEKDLAIKQWYKDWSKFLDYVIINYS